MPCSPSSCLVVSPSVIFSFTRIPFLSVFLFAMCHTRSKVSLVWDRGGHGLIFPFVFKYRKFKMKYLENSLYKWWTIFPFELSASKIFKTRSHVDRFQDFFCISKIAKVLLVWKCECSFLSMYLYFGFFNILCKVNQILKMRLITYTRIRSKLRSALDLLIF
jgi:hypothetical protein